uniref:Uncharacterized protein n=1 Tax=Anguilla anguilla TaxID=7936 RepID=A0A0E9UXP3_ANGAN
MAAGIRFHSATGALVRSGTDAGWPGLRPGSVHFS